MVLATSRNGDQLITIQAGEVITPIEGYQHLPLSFTCVVAQHEGRIVFVYNPYRHEWELPAGLIEQGEQPATCAKRELYEESGQIAHDMQHIAMVLLYLPKRQLYELGVLYRCDLPNINPFIANDEANSMMIWDLQTPVNKYVNEIAILLAQFARTSLP